MIETVNLTGGHFENGHLDLFTNILDSKNVYFRKEEEISFKTKVV